MSLRELETAVTKLPAEEFTAFAQWFQEYLADEWDRRIEADVKSGKLERVFKKVDAEFDAGKVSPL